MSQRHRPSSIPEPPGPVRLLDSRAGTGPLLRAYVRGTQVDDESAAAWQTIAAELAAAPGASRPDSPRSPPFRCSPKTALGSALAAACFAIWLLIPAHRAGDAGAAPTDATGGASGTSAPLGGTEGSNGRGDRKRASS